MGKPPLINVCNFRKEISRKLGWWYWFFYQKSVFEKIIKKYVLPVVGNGNADFSLKITIFEKITKKSCFFAIFLSTQERKKSQILKIAFEKFYWLKPSFWYSVFLFFHVFADF